METVKVRDMVLGDGSVKICVPVIAHTYTELEQTLKTLEGGSFDLVEFRADFYFEEESRALSAIRRAAGGRPILYTIRTKEEGGEIEISDDQYRERILEACVMADIVDIQLSRLHERPGNPQLHSDLVRKLHEMGVKVLLSWHDFDRTPKKEYLLEKLCGMQDEGCDIAKISVMPNSRQDVLTLMEASVEMLERHARRPFVTMSMGTIGKITRVAGTFTGSCITFGTAGMMSAPGQVPSDSLRQILKVLG